MNRQILRKGLLAGLLALASLPGCRFAREPQSAAEAIEVSSSRYSPNLEAVPTPAPGTVAEANDPPAPFSVPAVDAALNPAGFQAAPVRSYRELKPRSERWDLEEPVPRDHAADYSWLVGELQFVEVRGVWRIRYVSSAEEDERGGCATLVDTGSMSEFRPGQIVRVEGRFVDESSSSPSSDYRVRILVPLSPDK